MLSGFSKRGRGLPYQQVDDDSDISSHGDIPPVDEPTEELSQNICDVVRDRVTYSRRGSFSLRLRDELSAHHLNATYRFSASSESGNNSIEMASLNNIPERGNSFLREDMPFSSPSRHALALNNVGDGVENISESILEPTTVDERGTRNGFFQMISSHFPGWLRERRQQHDYSLVPISTEREPSEVAPATSSNQPSTTAIAASSGAAAVPTDTTGAALDIVEHLEDNSEEDDPFCHQALFLFGICCGIPLLWMLGALLWFVTPKHFYRSRAWGLVNVFLAMIFFIYWMTGVYFFSEPPIEDITIFSHSEHIGENESSLFQPGRIKYFNEDQEMIWIFVNTSHVAELVKWTPLISMPYKFINGKISQDFCKLQIVPDSRIAGKPAKGATTIRWGQPLCGLMSPLMYLSGRIQFLTTFRKENTMNNLAARSLENTNKSIEIDPLAMPQKMSYHSVSSFPNEIFVDQLFITDEKFPKNFVGSGLRCVNQLNAAARWLLHWEKEVNNPATPTVINFHSRHICSFVTLSTMVLTKKNAWQYTNVETLALRGLP